jgi:hypothetical protein
MEKGKHESIWYGPGKPPFTHPSPMIACRLPLDHSSGRLEQHLVPRKTRNLKVICVYCFKKHEIVMEIFEINP